MGKIQVRNKTSTVPSSRSILRIETRLVELGASGVNKTFGDYEGGEKFTSGLSFSIQIGKLSISYLLPSRVLKILDVFLVEKKRGIRREQKLKLFKQADRTAWRLLQEWVDIQATMIQLGQVEATEVFLPYLLVDEKNSVTLYRTIRDRGFDNLKLLEDRGSRSDG